MSMISNRALRTACWHLFYISKALKQSTQISNSWTCCTRRDFALLAPFGAVECFRAWRAVPLSFFARHGTRPNGPRQGADRGLQPVKDFDRPVAPQRTGVLGRCRY